MNARYYNGDYDREHPSGGNGPSWDAILRKADLIEAELRRFDMAKTDVGPACPVPAERFGPDVTDIHVLELNGMSLRDYFAIHAMGSDIALYLVPLEYSADGTSDERRAELFAEAAYRVADAMLAARERA